MKYYLDQFIRELKNRNYARNTIKVYSSHLKHFLIFGSLSELDPYQRISVFLDQEVSTNEQKRLAWSSIKLFYDLVLQKECPYRLSKSRNQKRLPDVLTNFEVCELLKCISNPKHHLIISILYGSGLRVSEVCNIKIKDIDFINLSLKIRNSKGNKDRYTLLSEKIVPGLKKLIENRGADDFLFETQSSKKYSIRTVQQIFSNALEKSVLQKKPTCHTLRHCFATHLVEAGVDIKTVKGLLGHQSIKTTMVYITLADPISRKIKSPL
jgi:site-specific recombinase XerD